MANVTSCFHLPDAKFESIKARFNSNVTTAVINAVCAPLAVAINLLVAFVVFRQGGLRQPSNLLLGYLAVSDLLVGLIVQPNYVLFRLLENYYGSVPCFIMMLYSTGFYICYGVSFTTLSAVSYERFVAVKSQVRYSEVVNASRVHKFVLAIWILNVALNALQWVPGLNQIVRGVHLTIWLLCLLSAGFFYCRIRLSVGRHNRSTRNIGHASFHSSVRRYRMEVKLTLNIAVVVVIYYILNLPVLCVTMYHQIVDGEVNYNYYSWSETLALLSSSVNPLVYCWKNVNVRRSIVQLFKDWPANRTTSRTGAITLRTLRAASQQAPNSTIGDGAAGMVRHSAQVKPASAK